VNDEITAEVLAELRPGDLIELHSREHFGYLYRGYVRRDRRDGVTRFGAATLSWPPEGEPCTWLKDFRLVVVERAVDRLYENSLRAQPVHGDVVRFQSGDDGYTNVYLPSTFSDFTAARPWIDLSDGHRYGSDDALPHGNGTQANYRITLLIDGTTGLPPVEVTW
jgi:hypothetical protein